MGGTTQVNSAERNQDRYLWDASSWIWALEAFQGLRIREKWNPQSDFWPGRLGRHYVVEAGLNPIQRKARRRSLEGGPTRAKCSGFHWFAQRDKIRLLKQAAKVAAAALMLVLLGQPIAACMTPGRSLTEEEHNCCKKMAQMCQTSAMPSSHSCCKSTASALASTVYKTRHYDFVAPAVLFSEVRLSLSAEIGEHRLQAKSPPESPPKISSVLRI